MALNKKQVKHHNANNPPDPKQHNADNPPDPNDIKSKNTSSQTEINNKEAVKKTSANTGETSVDNILDELSKNKSNNGDKNKGGRPKLDSTVHRKQYTLTLQKDTYNLIMSYAKSEMPKLSFAAFMERAALEYIKNNY